MELPNDPIFAALTELQTLSKFPLPEGEWPPWSRIRAALPADLPLPDGIQHVLVDLELDAAGNILAAAVGQRPVSPDGPVVRLAVVGKDGTSVIQPRREAMHNALAEIVAAAHVGGKFSPGERDGIPVAVKVMRVGIEVRPADLRHDPGAISTTHSDRTG